MTWERALEADARLAAKNSVLIRAALRQQFDAERAYQGYLNTTPNLELNIVQQRARARAWAVMNLRINLEPLKEVIYRTWAQAYVLGDTAAREAIQEAELARKADTRGVVDWSKWKPGDAAAAVILKPPRAFQKLLERQGITWKGFSDTTLTDIGNAIGEAITLGLDAKASAKLIANHVASPARALSIAITEQNRAISAATVERYQQAGLQQMEWLVFQPCDKCAQNAGKVVSIGGQFPSGDTQPPAHPHCRCALAPVIPGFDEQQAVPGATVITPPPPPAPVEVAAEVVEQVTPVAVSSAFVPGQWTRLSRAEIENRVIDEYLLSNPRYTREQIIDFIKSGRIKKADLAMIKSGRIIQNGPIEVQLYSAGSKVSPAGEKKLLQSIEKLQAVAPKDKMTIMVASEKGNAYGSAILGDAKIWLKPSTVMDDKPLKNEIGFKMPSIAVVPHRDYVLAHEWGHTIEKNPTFTNRQSIQDAATTAKIEELKKEFANVPEAIISNYAKTNTKEFYAEMYAEWFVTNGETANPLVRAMAKAFVWDKPKISRTGTIGGVVDRNVSNDGYRGYHRAPSRLDDVGGPATDIETGLMPDFYTRPNIYTTGMPQADKESVRVIQAIRNKPEAMVTIYRAVPTGVEDINPGDWVTLSRSYAETHLVSNVDGGHVISMKVPAKDLWFDGNSINEFGYDPVSK